VPKLRETLNVWRELFPVVQNLTNPDLKDRHWTKLIDVLGEYMDRGETLTLEALLKIKVRLLVFFNLFSLTAQFAYFDMAKQLALHYTTLHYTTLHYTTLHYTTLHYTTLHYTTLHYTALHYTRLYTLSLRGVTLLVGKMVITLLGPFSRS